MSHVPTSAAAGTVALAFTGVAVGTYLAIAAALLVAAFVFRLAARRLDRREA